MISIKHCRKPMIMFWSDSSNLNMFILFWFFICICVVNRISSVYRLPTGFLLWESPNRFHAIIISFNAQQETHHGNWCEKINKYLLPTMFHDKNLLLSVLRFLEHLRITHGQVPALTNNILGNNFPEILYSLISFSGVRFL